jgi:chromosome partitioning protein
VPVIAIANQKGGVGKTTITLGLAAAASHAGRRVLVIDLDPQANATTGLGVWDAARTVDDALAHERPGALRDVITTAGWPADHGRLPDVAPSTPDLAGRETQLATDPLGAQMRLRIATQGLSHELVLIDCPPSLGLLTINGLFAADKVLVATEPAAWSSDGVAQIMRTAGRISDRRHDELEIAGVVINKLARTRDGEYWHQQLIETYDGLALPPIRQRAAIAEASAQSLPLHQLGNRPGAQEAIDEFDALLARVLA